jgi:hypothetical protein
MGWRRVAPDVRGPAVSDLGVTRLGQPGDCPRCGGLGHLDCIDLRSGSQHQHCVDCGWAWELDIGSDAPIRVV